MCGIGGVSTKDPFSREEATICHRLLESLTRRGEHAWGYYDGETVHKEPGSFTDSPKYMTLVDDLIASGTNTFLCHTRFATKGDPEENQNNHPFSLDTLTMAHNGILYRTDEFQNIWGIETDSFWVLYWLAYEYRKLGNMPAAIDAGVDHVTGSYAIWTYCMDDEAAYLFRMANRLVESYFTSERDIVVFGSDWLSLLDALDIGPIRRRFKLLLNRVQPVPPGLIHVVKNGTMEKDGTFKPRLMSPMERANFELRYGHLYRYHTPFVTGAGLR